MTMKGLNEAEVMGGTVVQDGTNLKMLKTPPKNSMHIPLEAHIVFFKFWYNRHVPLDHGVL